MAEVNSKSNTFLIKGKAMYCNHQREGKFGGYGVDLTNLDDKTVKGLKALGIKVGADTEREPDDAGYKGRFVKLKADTPVEAKDMKGNVLPSKLIIGNGSTVYAAFRAKPWTHKESGRSGVRGVLLGLKVQELVEYDPEAANRAKADELLDGVSGEGFVFGGEQDDEMVEADQSADGEATEDVNDLFN